MDPSPTHAPRRARRRVSRILSRVASIPRGEARTYGDIDPRAPRLVGRVLARHGDIVPWHRVVRSDGTAPVGVSQLELLRIEKVPLRGKRVDLSLARGRGELSTGAGRGATFRPQGTAPGSRPGGRRPLELRRLRVGAIKTRTIRQWTWIPATPNAVYRALMTTRGHQGFTGASARMSPKVGGTFMAWDGYIHGSNVELVPGRKIVQHWTPTEEDWPEGHPTKVTFTLAPARGGTRISFTQSGVPSQHAGHLAQGWRDHYWERLKAYFESPRST